MPKLFINSRFRSTPSVQFNGENILGRWVDPEFMDAPPFATITVESNREGRLDLISNDYYSTPNMWWAIMAYNKMTNINWPKTGDIINIPDPVLVFGSQ